MLKKIRKIVPEILAAATTATLLAACGGGGGGGTATPIPGAPAIPVTPGTPSTPGIPPGSDGSGTLRIALTDAPACGFDEVNVTVERVRVHKSMSAGEGDGGWTDMVLNPVRKVDLLSLQNGILVDLGQATLPAGQYTQMRLMLSPNGSSAPANYVVPTNGGMMPVAMDTPSAQQSGLKLIHGFTIEAGKTTALVLDFDACKSIVKRGNGSFGLKPVIHVMPMTLTAIAGYVQTGLTGVTVSAQKDGVVMKATLPNASGQFVLAPLDPAKGPYDVVFTGVNLTTSVIAGVPVSAEQTTTLNSSLGAVTIPTSTSGTVTGAVGPAGARGTGAVRALQAVGTVPAVEVAHVNVDPATGDYSLLLPTAAPRLLNYSNAMVVPLNFQAQIGAGKYKLEASATGYVTQLGSEITALFGSILPNQNFTLAPTP
jgi:hypothetical protein